MSLPQKYRPASFDEVAGAKNRATATALSALLSKKDPPHAVLLHGPRGCGKTTIARLISGALGCVGDDFREVDSADFRGIDHIREVRRLAHYKPMHGPCRVWLLDEAHKITNDAQNALLKGLEDPPDHCYYVLATTDPEKLLPTIRSRCSTHQVYLLADDEMLRLLRRVASKEGADVPVPALRRVVEASRGHARDALQMLETVIADPASAESVALGASEAQAKSIDLCRALIQPGGWKKVRTILADLRNEDPEEIRRAVMGYCASVLLGGENPRAGEVMQHFADPTYDTGFPGLVLAAYAAVCGSGQ